MLNNKYFQKFEVSGLLKSWMRKSGETGGLPALSWFFMSRSRFFFFEFSFSFSGSGYGSIALSIFSIILQLFALLAFFSLFFSYRTFNKGCLMMVLVVGTFAYNISMNLSQSYLTATKSRFMLFNLKRFYK